MSNLLPINATPQELALEAATELLFFKEGATLSLDFTNGIYYRLGVDESPQKVRDVWNVQTCPPNILPWLAWAFSVDEWNTGWTDAQKRQVIGDSLEVQRRKGSVGAVRRAIDALGYAVTLSEWFEFDGDPYTFRLNVDVQDEGFPAEAYQEILRIVGRTKNVRSHLLDITTSKTVDGQYYALAGQYAGYNELHRQATVVQTAETLLLDFIAGADSLGTLAGESLALDFTGGLYSVFELGTAPIGQYGDSEIVFFPQLAPSLTLDFATIMQAESLYLNFTTKTYRVGEVEYTLFNVLEN